MAVVYTDRQYLKLAEVGLVASLPMVSQTVEVGNKNSDRYVFLKAAADGTASTATAETDFNVWLPRIAIVKSISFTPTGSTLVADPTNNAVFTLSKRDSAGATLTTVGTLTTNAAGLGIATLPQRGTCQFTLVPAVTRVAAGSTFTFSIAKGGTGVIIPVSFLTLEVEWD